MRSLTCLSLVLASSVALASPATDALDVAVAQVKAEQNALEAQKVQDAATIASLQLQIKELGAGSSPPPPPPPVTTLWPSGWDDPRFASNRSSPRLGSRLSVGPILRSRIVA
jgi:hypothetical protein